MSETVHSGCPLRYLRDGIDHCGATDSPCEYCVDRRVPPRDKRKPACSMWNRKDDYDYDDYR